MRGGVRREGGNQDERKDERANCPANYSASQLFAETGPILIPPPPPSSPSPFPTPHPQVIFTIAGVAAFSMGFAGLPAPSAIILGGALAMSTTAVGIQVLEDRGEMGSRHGRAIFSVLLLQVRGAVGWERGSRKETCGPGMWCPHSSSHGRAIAHSHTALGCHHLLVISLSFGPQAYPLNLTCSPSAPLPKPPPFRIWRWCCC
jgi:hypothetical protein